jgi:hypothetical protein
LNNCSICFCHCGKRFSRCFSIFHNWVKVFCAQAVKGRKKRREKHSILSQKRII